LIKALDDGEVRVQQHPEFPELQIFNYTEETQYRNRWNRVTLACRGLILNMVTSEVVARPWEKFFNFGQMDNRIESTAPVEVTDKVDGSLGILYKRPDDFWSIATRGSFASEQALHATEILGTHYKDALDGAANEASTFLFEIVYPDNRIVVNYGDMDDLVLLGAVNNQYGYYYGPQEAADMLDWQGPITEVWHYNSFVDALSFPDRQGKEGIVIRSGRNIVKLKQADYVELHRIVTNLSPKTVWQMLGDGKTVDSICADIPDEFHQYVLDIATELNNRASEIMHRARIEYMGARLVAAASQEIGAPFSRKKFAEVASKSEYKKYLFLLLDGKDIEPVVWDAIKPRGDIKSLVKDEG
jgi:RNA ligase